MEATKTEANKVFTTPEIKLHFLDYWRIIRIRKTVILAVFLLVSLTTTLVTFILPESYSSTVRIAVEKDTQDVTGLSERQYAPTYDPYFIQTEFEKIQSKVVLHKVIQSLELNRQWARKYKETGDLKTEETYLILRGQIDVRQSRNTSLIEISVYSEDRNEAAKIANEIAKVYAESRRLKRRDLTKGGIDVLWAQWNEQDKLVRTNQTAVDALKEKLKITDADEAGNLPWSNPMEPGSARQLEAERIAAQAQYEKWNMLYEQLRKKDREELKNALTVASPDTQLSSLLENENTAKQRLAQLSVSYAPGHPEVLQISNILATVQEQIKSRLDGILSGLQTRVFSEKAAVDELKRRVDEANEMAIQKSIERRVYWQAKRDLENLQTIRDKLRMNIIAQEVDSEIPKSAIVEVIDPAEPGMRPVRPNKTLNITLGVIVGLVIGIGLAFFIEYLDTSVKTIDDVERALQAPVLGVIPQNVGLLLEEGPDSPHAEAYRVLRTNLLFSRKDPKLNTMTIVSGGAGEGKSTTLFNLSTVFAQNGQRVLIIDSDLRRPSLHKFLKLSNTIGLTNYLMKQNTLEEVIQTTNLPTLDFMPSGKLPSSSLGILSSVQMKELIREVKRRYDFVFFDSPPIMGVSDASVLASEVDLVLQVIQYRRYPQPMTIRAKQMIEKVGGNLVGIVLNNINLAQDENYYYYSGYYYDYYSYEGDNYKGDYRSGEYGDYRSKESKPAKAEKVDIKPKY